jgi:hypothetical protein
MPRLCHLSHFLRSSALIVLSLLSSLSTQNVAAKQPDALETAASQLFASGFRGAILAARGDKILLQKAAPTLVICNALSVLPRSPSK